MSLDLTVDVRVLLFTTGVAVFTGLLFGLAPAWRAGRVSPQAAMKAQGRGVAEGSRFSAGKALVAGQVALSLVLIVGAGLLLGSWRRLATTDPGFHRDRVLLVNADIRAGNVRADRRLAVDEDILNRVRSLPGVRAASASQFTPVSGMTWNELLKVDGFTAKSEDDALSWANAITDGYFTTLGIPLLAGRDFDARDSRSAPHVAIVSESMARHFFGTPAAVGRVFQKQEGSGWSQPIEVVGVVADTKYRSLRDSAQSILYFPRSQESADASYVTFILRLAAPPPSVVPSVARAIADVNPRIAFDLKTLDQQLDESLAVSRSVATLSGFFGALAVLLATIGLYGIMAYTVARRRNEIGVRIALGAGQSRVVRLVLGDVGRILVAGVAIGIMLSLGVTRLVASFLYGVSPNDPATLIGSILLLAAVGVAAAALPAWRAARLDPVEALREE
jgi:predicted permease